MRLYHSDYVPPKGANWGILKDAKLDELIDKAHTSFDRAAQTKALADVHTYIVDSPTGSTSPTISTRGR